MTADSGESVITITLRDWFAGQALSGLLGNEKLFQELMEGEDDKVKGLEQLIDFSFVIATMMVKRRSEYKKMGFWPPAAS